MFTLIYCGDVCFFFFFQAEDGIRDGTVTGVQTCALPIWYLMLVQHMNEVPESLPVTEETRERLRAQANQLGEPTVVRMLDLLALAVDDMRQGGDPRLPLELALVKVTRPAADLSRESTAFRLEQLETRGPQAAPPGQTVSDTRT